jgi:hypothetical protein
MYILQPRFGRKLSKKIWPDYGGSYFEKKLRGTDGRNCVHVFLS